MYFCERTGMIEADSSEALRKACQYELKTESTKERSPPELRCQAWVLKNSVIGMSFWLRVSLLASFFFLASSPAVLAAARRHGLRLALSSGLRVCSQHPSHNCAQEKVGQQRFPEVAVRYRSGHQRVGDEQREAPYSE